MALTKISSNVIANNTIAVGNIADNSVDATKIASNSILTRHIDDDQITTDQIAANTIATANIADNAVDGTKIASNSILTRHIDDNQIGIDQLNVSDGSSGQALTTDGSGTLSFASAGETNRLPLAGGTMTGDITMGGMILNPNADGGRIGLNRNPSSGAHIGDSSLRRFQINGPDSTAGDHLQIQGYNSSGTHQGNLTFQDGNITLGDDQHIYLGDTTADFDIYHIGGSVSVVRSTPAMVLQSDDYISLGTYSDGELMLKATKNGSTDLYYDNAVTLETDTNGIKLKGGATGGVEYVTFNNGAMSLADNAAYTLSGIANTGCLIAIGQQRSSSGITYDHCLIFVETGTNAVTVANPSGRFSINTSGTDTVTNVYVSGGNVVLENKVGTTNGYTFACFVFQGN